MILIHILYLLYDETYTLYSLKYFTIIIFNVILLIFGDNFLIYFFQHFTQYINYLHRFIKTNILIY